MQNFMEIGPVVFAGEYLGMKIGCSSYNTSKPVHNDNLDKYTMTILSALHKHAEPDNDNLHKYTMTILSALHTRAPTFLESGFGIDVVHLRQDVALATIVRRHEKRS